MNKKIKHRELVEIKQNTNYIFDGFEKKYGSKITKGIKKLKYNIMLSEDVAEATILFKRLSGNIRKSIKSKERNME